MAEKEKEEKEKQQGLGDFVEKVIQTVAPKLAEQVKKQGCRCEEKKIWLNNFGAKFG